MFLDHINMTNIQPKTANRTVEILS